MSRRPKLGRAIRANPGTMATYRKRLDALIAEMHASLTYWLCARWKANTPTLATDENPVTGLRKTMRKLARRWKSRFDQEAPKLAEWLAKSVLRQTTRAMEDTLAAGKIPTVEFKISPTVRDAYNAVVGENVSLIRSVSERHLAAVEGAVMRSVQAGFDLGSLAKALEDQYGTTKKRAALIARDQNSKALAVITRVRQQEAGITQAIWSHAHGGKKPRPEHVAFDGKTYDVSKGAFLEGVWTWPGQEINCRCYSKPVLLGF